MKEKNRKAINTKGITLIALVITIVVLIILAVISINAIFGENGILERAGNSEEFHRKGEATEEVDMAWLDVQTEKVLGELKSPVDRRLEELLKQKDPNATVTVNGEQLDIFYKDYDFIKETNTLEVVDAKTMTNWNYESETTDVFLYILDSNGNLRVKKESYNERGGVFIINLNSIYDAEIINKLENVKVKALQLKRDTIYVITQEGDIWSWGNNYEGQCGVGSNEKYISTPTKLESITSKVKEVGEKYAIGEDGSVWTWGYNMDGQCGIGSNEEYIRTATRVDAITSKVKEAGDGYAIGEDGSLWRWGNNYSGECGIGSAENEIRTATRVNNIISKVKEIGDRYAIGEDDSLWTWGNNWNGECGIGSTEEYVRIATRVENMKNMIDIDHYFFFQIDTKNNIYQLDNGSYKATGEVYKRNIDNVIITESGKINTYMDCRPQ